MATEFTRWECKDDCDPAGMTPLKARDLIIRCFFEAQKEAFARSKKNLGDKKTSDAELQRTVESVVKLTFNETGCNFDNPSKEDLGKAIQALAKKSSMWGTPADIIDYHKGQITRILANLG